VLLRGLQIQIIGQLHQAAFCCYRVGMM